MSRSQFQSKRFILTHAWLNLLDKRMTTGRINQVAIFVSIAAASSKRGSPLPNEFGSFLTLSFSRCTDFHQDMDNHVNLQSPFQTYPGESFISRDRASMYCATALLTTSSPVVHRDTESLAASLLFLCKCIVGIARHSLATDQHPHRVCSSWARAFTMNPAGLDAPLTVPVSRWIQSSVEEIAFQHVKQTLCVKMKCVWVKPQVRQLEFLRTDFHRSFISSHVVA